MRVLAFLCVLLFSFAASAQAGDTVRIGQQVKNAYGIVVGMETGDIACTLTLEDDQGAIFKELADFDICDRRSMLLNKRVALRYAVQTLASPDCQGNLDCRKTISAIVVSDAKPTVSTMAQPLPAPR
jgi:hypothetical protein